MLKAGDAAPDFRVKDHAGKEWKLADFKGKSLVLWFFPKADTPGWTAEGCGFRDLKQDFDKKNAAILGVSFDTPEENRAFAEKFGFNYPLLCDTERTMGVAYGAAADRKASNANRTGVVVGPDGRIKEWHAKVSARTFPEEVLGRL